MSTMRYATLILLCGWAACANTENTTNVVRADVAKDTPELVGDDASRLVRSTERNVNHYFELLLQGETQDMVALRRTIGQAVDRDFPVFEKMALEDEYLIRRNMAVKCLGFAINKRVHARETLTKLCDDREITIVQNAALALGILRDKDTNLTTLVRLLAHPDIEVRTNAATSLRDLFLIKETPRDLTPQYWAAIDRLVGMTKEKRSSRARRAGIWALANIRHPNTLEHLVNALKDDDEFVQIGGLHGIQLLGDQRALEPLLEYLDDGPSSNGASYAKAALIAIAVQGGFAKTPSECDDLGTNPKEWKRWFRAKRMQ